MLFSQLFSPRNPIKTTILRIKTDMRKLVSKHCDEKFFILWYGAYHIDPKHLVYWICVETDAMKQTLALDDELNTDLRTLLRKHYYPAEVCPFVHIGFESEETVQRESGGNWYHHFK